MLILIIRINSNRRYLSSSTPPQNPSPTSFSVDRYAEHDFSHVDMMESSVGSHLDNSLDLSGSSIKSNSSFSVPPPPLPVIECGLNNNKSKTAAANNSLNNSNFVSIDHGRIPRPRGRCV